MGSTRVGLLAASAFFFGFGFGLVPAAALACGNTTWRTLHEGTREVARAEEELESGHADRAWGRLRNVAIDDGSEETWRHRRNRGDGLIGLGSSDPPPGRRAPTREVKKQHKQLVTRLVRVRAVAGMRARNIVSDALDTLGELVKEQKKDGKEDPWLKARLAEALGRRKRWPEVLKLLADLEQRDLLPDPEAWATLAAARAATGDAAGAEAGRTRCEKVAKRPDQCTFPPKDPSLAAKQASR